MVGEMDRHMRESLDHWLTTPPEEREPFADEPYCIRCANSGCGACDDYPNCPNGRADEQSERDSMAAESDDNGPPYGDN